ncbi:nickel-dependent hydrogenase large subunit [Alteromonas lipolytica]|uniref:HupV protein n=1 Tax=Alteromonas lipolytica TaxID=1856405 RepID=A0A1E8FDW3_9ALTE|nr:nickel-dependent hydrogenase large subunit [Alteromonas lipolytica]OFI34125.1 HupV protein [Alteromonas lipolytica]GGF65193.1 HupV protein [Alteromonas lipolytica]
MSRIVAGPFNRVEGDLEITLQTASGKVQSAEVNSPLYRGFERILLGHKPMDALVYTPRICGICSVTQSVASARALADVMNLSMPVNGELCTNLVLANENITDLLTHFYLFFMPDFARDTYADKPWFNDIHSRFKATSGSAAAQMLPARADFLHLMGIMAGKWPHTLSLQPGGVAKAIEPKERMRLLAIVAGFKRFLENTLFGDSLATISQLQSEAELWQWCDEKDWQQSDFRRFLQVARVQELSTLGRGTDHFLSFGAYGLQGQTLWASGSYCQGDNKPLAISQIAEDHSHSWMTNTGSPHPPAQGITQPSLDNEAGYSWCKAPRLANQVVEVGPLARQVVDGHPLIRDLVARSGGNVLSRIVARLLEMALVVQQMELWIKQIDPKAPFCHHGEMPGEARGVGLVEAARGSLGHWLEVKNGKISNYQIIAPTSWNFSPRDNQEQPGALEQAVVGAPVAEGEKTPVSVQHIVRSFDPCMACTVH